MKLWKHVEMESQNGLRSNFTLFIFMYLEKHKNLVSIFLESIFLTVYHSEANSVSDWCLTRGSYVGADGECAPPTYKYASVTKEY